MGFHLERQADYKLHTNKIIQIISTFFKGTLLYLQYVIKTVLLEQDDLLNSIVNLYE